MTPQHAFDCLSEEAERVMSRWWGAGSYIVLNLVMLGLGWDWLDRFIYVTNGLLVVLLIGTGRRDAKAEHAKLDRITPGHDLDGIEKREEREIDEAREVAP